MSVTQQTTQQTTQKPKTETEAYIVVDFLELNTSLFTFTSIKTNQHGGKSVGIRYDGRILYVKYGDKVHKFICPFGIGVSADLASKPDYDNNKKTTGYNLAIGLPKEYHDDPYFLKAKELDEFFVNVCMANACKWGLGGTPTQAPARESIAGYDSWGDQGKWKRLLKPSYKLDKTTNTRKYQDEYAPRMEFGIKSTLTESINDKGLKVVSGEFNTHFFDKNGAKLDNCRSENMQNLVPKMSSVTVVAHWQSIALGVFGASMKPKAEQIMVFPRESLTAECLLGGGDDGDEEGSGLLSENLMEGLNVTPVQQARPPPLRAQAQAQAQAQAVTNEYEDSTMADGEMQFVNMPSPAPVPAPTAVRPPVRRVVPAKQQ